MDRYGLWDYIPVILILEKETNKEEISMMTPTTLFLTILGVCTVSAQVMKFLVWVDEPGRSH